jgi:hypothetical protein
MDSEVGLESFYKIIQRNYLTVLLDAHGNLHLADLAALFVLYFDVAV